MPTEAFLPFPAGAPLRAPSAPGPDPHPRGRLQRPRAAPLDRGIPHTNTQTHNMGSPRASRQKTGTTQVRYWNKEDMALPTTASLFVTLLGGKKDQ